VLPQEGSDGDAEIHYEELGVADRDARH